MADQEINDLAPKAQAEYNDEYELQETGGGSSAKVTSAGIVRQTVVSKATAFTIGASDGHTSFYVCTGSYAITIPTTSAGGFSVGDVITLHSTDGNQTFSTTGVTVNVPDSSTLGFLEGNATISLVVTATDTYAAMGLLG